MTEKYWQNYVQQVALDPMNRKDPFWSGIRQNLERKKQPKHHLELYSMCRSDNPYIRQIKSSPNITTKTASQLICREKACQLQYCLSLMRIATENKRNIIDLKGCKEQYDTMQSCIKMEQINIEKREQELRNAVHGVQTPMQEKPLTVPQKQEQKQSIYI